MEIKKSRSYHLEIRKNRKSYTGIIRSTYRESDKVKHKTHGRLSGLNLEELKLLQAAFRGEVVRKDSPEALRTTDSREYGASYALLELAKDIGLDEVIYSRVSEPWVRDALAMIVGRLVYAGSKLSLSNEWRNTTLWELCGVVGKVDVEQHCYESMDHLFQRQQAIQRTLAKKHLGEGSLVLYDITSSYFEGDYEQSEIAAFGYNRDGKRGHEQMVIGLLCNEEGCPVAVEVFRGNTQDATTVMDKILEIQTQYAIQKIIFVGDRGMVTQSNYEKLKQKTGVQVISALTHPQIQELIDREVIQVSLFRTGEVVEVLEPDAEEERYCLCKNPQTARREHQTRKQLIEETSKQMARIANTRRKSTAEQLGARVGKALAKYKVGKFFDWKIEARKLIWEVNQPKVQTEQQLDGCYIIRSNVSPQKLSKEAVVASYKKLQSVEMAFRNLKTVQLEVRPVFHKTDDRIRCHVFICMLAYYLQWQLKQKLQPLFDGDGQHKHRQWTLQNVLNCLATIRQEKVSMNGVTFNHKTTPNQEQKYILQLIGVKM